MGLQARGDSQHAKAPVAVRVASQVSELLVSLASGWCIKTGLGLETSALY